MTPVSFPSSIFPLFGDEVKKQQFAPINLGPVALEQTHLPLHTQAGLEEYIEEQLKVQSAQFGFGGYLEKRTLYQSSPLFGAGTKARIMHLGIDLWAPAGTTLFLPLRALVHSFQYNDGVLDYGATILLTCPLPSGPLHLLLGHLSLDSLEGLAIGQMLEPGTPIARLGVPSENGGWVPHVHVQLIRDLQGKVGDYPGVVSEEELDYYAVNCPDPSPLLAGMWTD